MAEQAVSKRRVKIDKDIDVSVTSNVRASFGYIDKRGTTLELDNHGDTDYLTFGELKTMASSRHKKSLHNMYLLITDIDHEDYTVEDVLRELRLEKYYNPVQELFDEVALDESSFDEFVKKAKIEKILEAVKHDHIIACLTESAVELYRKGDIQLDKTKAIFEACGVSNFYDFLADLSPE